MVRIACYLALLIQCSAHAQPAPEVDVVAHGADPTGAVDCTEVLTRLHATGQRVYYPNGTYRFNGMTLDLSGGVRFETPTGVTVRNDLSDANVLQLDDVGNLVGLQHNHLELNEAKLGGPLPMGCGSLVPPPLSTRPVERRVDVLGYWYNDFGLETRRANPGSGWIGWYYWTWNFHGSEGDAYDPSRHPLLGFYRGDDPTVLDWQCYWLREYGVAGAILLLSWPRPDAETEPVSAWEAPRHANHWVHQLLNHVPNARGIGYVMAAPTPYASSSPEVMARVEAQWRELIENVYLKYPGFYAVERGGKRYPLLYLHEESGLRGVFDNYNGSANLLAFYRRTAMLLREHGFGGVALLCRHGLANEPALLEALAADGVLHLSGSYAALPATGDTYAERVASYAQPVDCWTAPNVVTSCHTHTPHPSKWNCPGSTPELFGQMLSKAADVACAGVPAPDQQGSRRS